MGSAIKIAAVAGGIIALPLALAGAWVAGAESNAPPPVVKVFVDPTFARPTNGDRIGPQFDSGDPRFTIDPDGTDDDGRGKGCGDDCDGPDDPAQAVIPT